MYSCCLILDVRLHAQVLKLFENTNANDHVTIYFFLKQERVVMEMQRFATESEPHELVEDLIEKPIESSS